jgi:hypothetical protein
MRRQPPEERRCDDCGGEAAELFEVRLYSPDAERFVSVTHLLSEPGYGPDPAKLRGRDTWVQIDLCEECVPACFTVGEDIKNPRGTQIERRHKGRTSGPYAPRTVWVAWCPICLQVQDASQRREAFDKVLCTQERGCRIGAQRVRVRVLRYRLDPDDPSRLVVPR